MLQIKDVTKIVPKASTILSSSSTLGKYFKVTVIATETEKLLDHEIRPEDIHVRKFPNRRHNNY